MKTFEVLWDLFDLSLAGMAGAARRVSFMGQPKADAPPSGSLTQDMWSRFQAGKTYLHALFRLTVFSVCVPLLMLILGMLSGLGWLVAIVGIFWTVCSLLLLILAAPLGMLIEFILGGIKGIGARYVRFSLGLFLVELLFSLFVSIVPIENNPSALPVVIIAAAIIGIVGALSAKTPAIQKFVGVIVGIVFVLFTLSFFLPQTFRSVRSWGSRLDMRIASQVDEPAEGTAPRVEPKTMPVPQGARKPGTQSFPRNSAGPETRPGESETPTAGSSKNDVRVRRILGTAYSYTKDAWALVDPIYGPAYGSPGYPHPYLVFWSGLVAGAGAIQWDASYALQADHLVVVISKLKVGASGILAAHYADIGVGYEVLLENGVFADYTMAKTILVFRTFGGDSPPPKIEKSYEIQPVEMRQEQPYLISGEWTGSFDVRRKDGSATTTDFVARFTQNGNRFEGVILDAAPAVQDDARQGRARARAEGVILDGRVTFVKTYQEQIIGASYVATYVRGVESLEGSWYLGILQSRWRMTRRGEFEGTVDDILSVDAGKH